MKLPSEPAKLGATVVMDDWRYPVDYSEYMWMGEEMEEFDRMVGNRNCVHAFIGASRPLTGSPMGLPTFF